MKKGLLFIFFATLLSGCSYFQGSSEALILDGEIEHTIVATTSAVAGQIIDMKKGLGEEVKKNDIIAIIDHEQQQFAVQQLEKTLLLKEASLTQLLEGTRPEQIAQAKSVVHVAEAKLAELKAGSRPEQIEQANTRVTAAKARLDLAQSGSRDEQLAQANNGILLAQEAYNTQLLLYEQLLHTFTKTEKLVTSGLAPQHELEAIQNQLDLAKQQLTTFELQINNAEQQLLLLQNNTVAEEITIAQASYDEANAQLAFLQKGANAQAIRAAEAEIEAAKAQLALLSNGVTQSAIDVAQADMAIVQTQLEAATAQLERYFIRALSDGRIISKSVELGNVITAGMHIADIASNELTVNFYVPTEFIHLIHYGEQLTVQTPTGNIKGTVSYIALEDEYMPHDQQTGEENKPIATKVKVTIPPVHELNPSTSVQVILPLQ